MFADANLVTRNLGRRDANRDHLEASLSRTFSQDVIFLGDEPGDVPEHHIMMYMMPLDDHTVLVGDVRLGQQLAPDAVSDPAIDQHAARFDRVADELAQRGFAVTRIPVVVLPGAGSYVTYTNASVCGSHRSPMSGGTASGASRVRSRSACLPGFGEQLRRSERQSRASTLTRQPSEPLSVYIVDTSTGTTR